MIGNSTTKEPWSEDELTELGQLYSVGIPIEHVAKFLGRNLDEAELEVRSLNISLAAIHRENRAIAGTNSGTDTH